MDFINEIITNVIANFDFSFCVTVNILTYLIIKTLEYLNGDAKLTTWNKRLVLVFVIGIISYIYYIINIDIKLIVNSAILAPVFWSWICKPICNKFNIDYSKYIDKDDVLY